MVAVYMVIKYFCLLMSLWSIVKQGAMEVVASYLGVPAGNRDRWCSIGFMVGAWLCVGGIWGETLNQLNAPAHPEVAIVATGVDVSDSEEMKIFLHWIRFRPRAAYVAQSHDCDDFASEYYYALKLHGFKVGYATSAKAAHAWNAIACAEGRVIHWEPQTGKVYRQIPDDTRISYDKEKVERLWVRETLLESSWNSQMYAMLFY